ncbi:MAG: hypothetical protein K9L59_20235 [Desulfobacterales bacterium]|nr:hypothetical protein [Desulfobacterales bacterium]
MRQFLYPKIRRVLVILPVAAAVAVVAYLAMHRPGPEKRTEAESVRVLRVIKAPLVDLVPRATGYGVAGPGQVWEAVSEVKGTVVEVHPQLDSGEILASNSMLVKIDPTEYKLAVTLLEADTAETRARLDELAAEKENTKRLLSIEKRSLELARKSFERRRTLLKQNAVSPEDVDREERSFLQQRQKVRQLENTLSLIPSRVKTLKAALAANQARLKQTKIDLAKTVIKAPFECRLSGVGIEAGQFVRTGQSLFKGLGTGVTETEARFRAEELRSLLGVQNRGRLRPGIETDTFKRLFQNIEVIVRLAESGSWTAQWQARVDRIREEVDAKTREIRLVAAVDRPYEKAVPGQRPPLITGMFCEVTLRAPVRPESVVLPRSAVHDQTVFIVDSNQRLREKQITVDFAQSNFVVIRSGLSGGESVVVSDPSPAIVGMKVLPQPDAALRHSLIAASQAKGTDQ